MIRLNSEYITILKANSKRDLKLILTNFNLPGFTEEDIYLAYKESTAHKGQCLFIDSVKQIMRQNFTGRIFNEKKMILMNHNFSILFTVDVYFL